MRRGTRLCSVLAAAVFAAALALCVSPALGSAFRGLSSAIEPMALDGSVYDVTTTDRVQISFYSGNALVSTQIVRAGDTLVSPSSPASATEHKVFGRWAATSALGTTDLTVYLDSPLTTDQIQNLCSYAQRDEAASLYTLRAEAQFIDAHTVRFHQYTHKESVADEGLNSTFAFVSLTDASGAIALSHASSSFTPIVEGTNAELVGWQLYAEGAAADAEPVTSYEPTQTVSDVSADIDFYPALAQGFSVSLDTSGASSLERVFVRDTGSGSGTLALASLPTEKSLAGGSYHEETGTYDEYYRGWYLGWTLEGWYRTRTGEPGSYEYDDKVTEDTAINEDMTLYAKWAPRDDTSYSIVNMIEDEKGTPGNGDFSMFNAVTMTGTTGSAIGSIDSADLVKEGYHKGSVTEMGARPELNGGDSYVRGDGGAVKYQYWFRNYYRVKFYTGRQNRPGSVYLDVAKIKRDEAVQDWAGDRADYMVTRFHFTDGWYRGLIMTWSGGSVTKAWEYDVNTFMRLVSYNAPNGATINAYYDDGNFKAKRGYRTYTELNGDEPPEAEVSTKTFKSGTYQFVLTDERWEYGAGSQGSVYTTAKSSNRGIYTLGYLYKGGLRDTSLATADAGYSYEEGVYDSSDGIYWKTIWQARNSFQLNFTNIEGLLVTPEKPLNYDAIPFEKKLASYFPFDSESTMRRVGDVTYAFRGWYTSLYAAENWSKEESAAERVDVDTVTMPEVDTSYYAAWEAVGYDVTFDSVGGQMDPVEGAVLSEDGQTLTLPDVKSGSRLERPATPVKTVDGVDYTFTGWYKDEAYAEPWDFLYATIQGPTTLYAKWVKGRTYNVTYHDASGSEITGLDSSIYRYGSRVSLLPPSEASSTTRPFLGWSLVKDNPAYVVGQSVTILSNTDLFAVFGEAMPGAAEDDVEEGAPALTLESNYPEGIEGHVTQTLQATRVNAAVTLPTSLAGLSAPGYHITGWCEQPDGSAGVYAPGTTVAVPADSTLYAQWTPNQLSATITASYTYDGLPHEPVPEVLGWDGHELVEGVDYELTYANTINAADAGDTSHPSVTVSGIGEYAYAEPVELAYSIARRSVTITAGNASSHLGESLAELTWTMSGTLVAADDLGTIVATTNADAMAVGDYETDVSYDENSNYDVTVVKGSYRVTAATLVVSAQGWSGMYDGASHAVSVTLTSAVASTEGARVFFSTTNELTPDNYESGSLEPPSLVHVGRQTVYYFVVGTESAQPDEEGQAGSVTLEVTPAPLTVTARSKGVTYGDDPANDGVDFDGFVGTDSVSSLDVTGLSYAYTTVDGTGTYQAGSPSGTYRIVPSNVRTDDYAITYVPGTLVVGRRTVGVAWSDVESFAYTGTVRTYAGASATNLYGTDQLKLDVSGVSATDAGDYTASVTSLTGTGSSNYTLPLDGLSHVWEVTQAANSATVSIDDWTYGSQSARPSAISGFGVSTATFEYATTEAGPYQAALPAGAGGTYPEEGTYYVRAVVPETSNWADATSPAKGFRVTARALNVAAQDKTVTFGDNPPAYEASWVGFAPGESETDPNAITGTLGFICSYERGSHVGTYPIQLGGVTASHNYDLSLTPASLTVLQATNSWTVEPGVESKTYDGMPAAVTMPEAAFCADGEPTVEFAPAGADSWSATVPTDAGSYVMRATVEGTDDYTGLQTTVPFQIDRATWPDIPATALSATESTVRRAASGTAQDLSVGTVTIADFDSSVPTEYTTNGGTSWMPVPDSGVIEGLEAGMVSVRHAADANHIESQASSIEVTYNVSGSVTWDWNYTYVDGTSLATAVVNDTPQERSSAANLYLMDGGTLVSGYPVVVSGATDAGRDATLTHAYGVYELHGLSAGRSYSLSLVPTVATTAGDEQIESASYSSTQHGDDFGIAYVGVGNFDGNWEVALASADSDGHTGVQGVYVKVFWASRDNAALQDPTVYEVVSQQNDDTLGTYCIVSGEGAARLAQGSLPVWKMNTDGYPSRYRARIMGFRVDGVDFPCSQDLWSSLANPLRYDEVVSTDDHVVTAGEDPMHIAVSGLRVPMVALDANGGSAPEAGDYVLGQEALGSYSVAQATIEPRRPTWDNHVFEGWFWSAAPTATDRLSDDVNGLTQKVTLYAHWSENQPVPEGLASTKVSAQVDGNGNVVRDSLGNPVTNADGTISGVDDAMEWRAQASDGTWPDGWTSVQAGSSAMDGLPAGTYQVRRAATLATENAWAKNVSEPATVIVQAKGIAPTPAAPVVASHDATSIVVEAVPGQAYSIDGGLTWVVPGDGATTVTFEGLTPGTEQSVVTRVIETDELYHSDKSMPTTLTLPKLDLVVTIPPEALALVYNGEDREIVVPPSSLPEGCAGILYNVNGAAWQEGLPVRRDVDYFYIDVRYLGDDIHNDYDLPEPIVARIGQAENGWTTAPSIQSWVAGQAQGTPTAVARFGEVAIAFASRDAFESHDDETPWSTELPSEPGSYVMRASVEEAVNWSGLDDVVSFDIVPDTLSYDSASSLAGGATASNEGATGAAVTVADCGYSWAHHVFAGWNTERDGSGEAYAPGDPYVLTVGEDVLYAQWDPRGELAYDGNGATSGTTAAQPGREGAAVAVRACGFAREGYEFAGWNTEPDGHGHSYAPGDSFTLSLGGDVLYAQWRLARSPAEGHTMHRLYNPNSGEHFYTASEEERDAVAAAGWSYEGVGWVTPASKGTPVYRLYNPNAGDHHYTLDAGERDALVAVGWRYEGVGWLSDPTHGVRVWRQYNPNALAGAHNFTTSEAEHVFLCGAGWRGEGVAWYGVR